MEHQYLDHMARIYREGSIKTDRTGTGTRSLFGLQMRHDLSKGFPLLTTKKVHFKSVVAELIWLLSGKTNIQPLLKMGCTIWTEWPYKEYVQDMRKNHIAEEDILSQKFFEQEIIANDEFARFYGELGPVYGRQWRAWPNPVQISTLSTGHPVYMHYPIDQITEVIKNLKRDPDGRRHVVSAWNVADLPDMALSPCHALFQFYVADGKLSCQLYQRSADWFLGVPFNIASYSLLTMMVAQQVGLQLGEFIWTGGDCHLYLNHEQQVIDQLTRAPKPLPQLLLSPVGDYPEDIFSYGFRDFELYSYDPYPAIPAPVAV